MCKHTFGEQDTAVMDGECPICLSEELAALRLQLAEARKLLEVFAEQAELIAHVACDDECEYQQAAEYIKRYPAT